VNVPAKWKGRDLTLSLGPTDKSDVTYFNGVRIGSITMEQRPDAWCTPRVYTVPGKLVKPGRNVIAVRVFSNIYQGGFIGVPSQMRLTLCDDASAVPIQLDGAWRYKIEANFGLVPPAPPPPEGPGNQNSPYILFENMIRPIVPYGIRGAIWYQGESNAGKALQYRSLFPLMIRSWREAWKQGEFPFYFVQLANYMLVQDKPAESAWAELREAQAMTLAEPNTAVAVAIDIGEANDIHPRNKQDVGIRLALPALAKVHGFDGLVYSGPRFKSMRREGSKVRLTFDHVGGGLVARGGKLEGFAVAGKAHGSAAEEQHRWVWADAVIEGDTVVVSSPHVKRPLAVRYAWADNPRATLCNASDLPAVPFRTDKWPGVSM
jgi:sialate O-acetylesterase